MRRDSGFSMVELMIAMTVTLIVSGAIYGLLTSGSAAFRREPEMADRQQNIRMAMDLIARDVFNAGSSLPSFAQVFTRDDPAGGSCTGGNGVNGCGAAGALGSAAQATRAPGDGGDPSANSDVLELLSTDESCPMRSVCSDTQVGGFTSGTGDFVLRHQVPACASPPGIVMLTDGTSFALHMSQAGAAPLPCPVGGNKDNNGTITLGPALPLFAPHPLLPAPTPAEVPPAPNSVFFYAGQIIRYMIAPSNDPLDPGPALWRSRTGRFGTDGNPKIDPDGNPLPAGSPWQLMARGIEDLQVEYMGGDGLWRNRAPFSVANDWTTLVRRVRITLSARTSAPNLQGATTAGAGAPTAVRGQLITVVTPRAAFNELQMGSQIQ